MIVNHLDSFWVSDFTRTERQSINDSPVNHEYNINYGPILNWWFINFLKPICILLLPNINLNHFVWFDRNDQISSE
jgi:hypothetical protein